MSLSYMTADHDFLKKKKRYFHITQFIPELKLRGFLATEIVSLIYNLKRWSVSVRDPYKAPEQMNASLVGFRDNETKPVITSPIVGVNGKTITTLSGSTYILEDPDPEYLDFLFENNIPFDPINPIKIRK
jgi:hypothetical protein